jgi:hypothetical protein
MTRGAAAISTADIGRCSQPAFNRDVPPSPWRVFSAAAAAQGEHQRRLAAELAVMLGDLRRIEANSESPQHREGLHARLAGALSSLPLLLRRAGADAAAVPPLRAALAQRDWRALRAGLDTLKRRHPFEPGALLPQAATPERLRLGDAIHRQACAGCHEAPATGTLLPAFNLFEQRAAARGIRRPAVDRRARRPQYRLAQSLQRSGIGACWFIIKRKTDGGGREVVDFSGLT